MSTCKIKASAAFIMYLIWKDIYSHYMKHSLKKEVFVNLDWHYSNSWKERDILVNLRWKLHEFHNLVGQMWTIVLPSFPTLDACSPELSPGWKQHICFPNLCCFQWGNRQPPTRTLKMPAHVASTLAFLRKQHNRKKLFYMGNRLVALGSKATLHEVGTVFHTHNSVSDPPAPSGYSGALL